MVWSVRKCVVIVATANRVITWTEPVHTDVTRECMEINVTWVIKFVIFKQFSTKNLNCNMYTALTLKYQLHNMVLDETCQGKCSSTCIETIIRCLLFWCAYIKAPGPGQLSLNGKVISNIPEGHYFKINEGSFRFPKV